jgi:hypothetical protein
MGRLADLVVEAVEGVMEIVWLVFYMAYGLVWLLLPVLLFAWLASHL